MTGKFKSGPSNIHTSFLQIPSTVRGGGKRSKRIAVLFLFFVVRRFVNHRVVDKDQIHVGDLHNDGFFGRVGGHGGVQCTNVGMGQFAPLG